jgi:hypothetical protein
MDLLRLEQLVVADVKEVVKEIYSEKAEGTLRLILGTLTNAHGHWSLHSIDPSRIRLSLKCKAAP